MVSRSNLYCSARNTRERETIYGIIKTVYTVLCKLHSVSLITSFPYGADETIYSADIITYVWNIKQLLILRTMRLWWAAIIRGATKNRNFSNNLKCTPLTLMVLSCIRAVTYYGVGGGGVLWRTHFNYTINGVDLGIRLAGMPNKSFYSEGIKYFTGLVSISMKFPFML